VLSDSFGVRQLRRDHQAGVIGNEPFTATIAKVQTILKEFARFHGCVVTVVTHDRGFVGAADQEILAVDGKIRVAGLAA
jgi:hypothetical protein